MGIIRQAVAFIGISGLGWLLDFFVFNLLHVFCSNLLICNSVSSWVGVSFVFFFASQKIFRDTNRLPIRIKYGMYIMYQALLIYFVSVVLAYLNQAFVSGVFGDWLVGYSAVAAKIAVTPITMLTNFVVMRLIIERL